MPATPASHAIQKFRSGLRAGAFVHGAAQGLFAAAVAMAVTIVAARYAGAAWGGVLLGPAIWIVPVTAALACGAWSAVRRRMDDRAIARHLEARLPTAGLLLAAEEGADLGPDWRGRLEDRLVGVAAALPTINWRAMWARPAVAFALLVAMQWLPAVADPTRAQATVAAIERLERRLEQVAELDQVSPQKLAELRGSVRQLEQRAREGDTQLWRDIDRLQERIEQERALASSGDAAAGETAAGATGTEAAGGGERGAAAPGELAEALRQLEQFDAEAVGDALADLPEATRQAIDAARRPDGTFDADRLPGGAEQREQLGEAVAELAQQLSEQAATSGSELAESLAELAERFEAGGEPPAGESGGAAGASADAMRAELAKAAAEMADLGLAENMPTALQRAMSEAALDALGNLDPDQLRALLPDDLSQLQDLAKSMEQLAKQFGSGEAGGSEPPRSAGMPQLGEAAREQLAKLAAGLGEQLAGIGGEGRQGGDQAEGTGTQGTGTQGTGNQETGQQGTGMQGSDAQANGAGASGARSNAGNAPATGAAAGGGTHTEGGGHTALRMTENALGGIGEGELRVGRDDHDNLPGEWLPTTIEKGAPEVGDRSVASPRAGGSRPTGGGTGGGATWQLQLMPRHREVVRRYFAERGK